ncbi:hypothetical protein M3Y99_00026300 [Aphelenchoides fujianensis]|nr:hypothetical protein M3Y99_00026300 [Aphelenchoides fujianensis]
MEEAKPNVHPHERCCCELLPIQLGALACAGVGLVLFTLALVFNILMHFLGKTDDLPSFSWHPHIAVSIALSVIGLVIYAAVGLVSLPSARHYGNVAYWIFLIMNVILLLFHLFFAIYALSLALTLCYQPMTLRDGEGTPKPQSNSDLATKQQIRVKQFARSGFNWILALFQIYAQFVVGRMRTFWIVRIDGNPDFQDIKQRPYEIFSKWRETFGSVYTIWFAEMPVVVLSDFSTIQAVVQESEVYAGRQGFGKQSEIMNGGNFGVLDTSGDVWRDQRRFILSTFRDFGMGTSENLMQTRVHEQFGELFDDICDDQMRTGSVDLPSHVERCIDFVRYRKQVHELVKDFFTPTALTIAFVPFAYRLPYFSTYYKKTVQMAETYRRYFDHELREHQRLIDSGEVDETNAEDFVFKYMLQIRKDANDPQSTFHEKQLQALVSDLFITGQETTSATLVFLIIYVLNHMHVQRELHRELDEKIGSERLVEMADRSALVYLNAVINEAQRLHNLLPVNLMRKTSKEVTIDGQRIPANSVIFPNPQEFKPERFIDEDGKLKKVEELIPFSVGARRLDT